MPMPGAYSAYSWQRHVIEGASIRVLTYATCMHTYMCMHMYMCMCMLHACIRCLPAGGMRPRLVRILVSKAHPCGLGLPHVACERCARLGVGPEGGSVVACALPLAHGWHTVGTRLAHGWHTGWHGGVSRASLAWQCWQGCGGGGGWWRWRWQWGWPWPWPWPWPCHYQHGVGCGSPRRAVQRVARRPAHAARPRRWR